MRPLEIRLDAAGGERGSPLSADLPDAIGRGLAHLAASQDPSGSWKGDYGGPLFLLPLFVATARTVGVPLDPPTRDGMERYLRSHQRGDGGFGLHVEGASHVFTTALVYVALRWLGVGPEDDGLALARRFLARHGGPTTSAPWGKLVLAVLGLHDWDGVPPICPELVLAPRALPFHPSRLWCHARMVYLPMAYLYGRRAVAPPGALGDALRGELYGEDAQRIDWRNTRQTVAPTDRHVAATRLGRGAAAALSVWERVHPRGLRQRAIARIVEIVRAEDEATAYLCLGPVNKLLNTLVWHFEKPDGPELARHRERLADYLWRGSDGTKMQGYNSSETWDTALAVQAIFATRRQGEHAGGVRRAHAFLRDNQVLVDPPRREAAYRDASQGGWPFSTREHGWPISDCTAEGLKASLLASELVDDPLPAARLVAAVDRILALQNRDGGWATYERIRGPRWLELLNPSACFAEIMVERSYPECTSACLQALEAFAAALPDVRTVEIRRAVARGLEFLLASQRSDGSWEGSWGICFTYGTWYGTWGLRAAGLPPGHEALARAARFLIGKQLPDGGWGETPESSRLRAYVHAEQGQAVMTAWATLALHAAGFGESEAARRGIAFLKSRQGPDGSYPPEHIAGVFNRTCAIHYDNYLKIFPLWALAIASRAASEGKGGHRCKDESI